MNAPNDSDVSVRPTLSNLYVKTTLLRGVCCLVMGASFLAGCGYVKKSTLVQLSYLVSSAAQPVPTAPPVIHRGFLGAFFRPNGPPPFGVFSVYSKQEAPEPTPAPQSNLFGPHGYCDAVSADGLSISSGYRVDSTKLDDIVSLGVRWTRTDPAPFWDDHSHVVSDRKFTFADFDSAQCALIRHHITPLIALEAGPVVYDAIPGQYSPKEQAHYKTPEDFAAWCAAVSTHERSIFTAVHRYSMPGNEVNSNAAMFPDGDAQIAAFTQACYRAVKRADPRAFVYGLELNMEASTDPTGLVKRLVALGCGPGTCYDGLSAHMSLTYPIPPADKPCLPNPGGDYGVRCLADLRTAAGAPIHIIIGETVYTVPGSVIDEAMKARAIVAEMKAFAALGYVDGASYANVDECDLYPSGFFSGGCLIDSIGKKLPAFYALQRLAKEAY